MNFEAFENGIKKYVPSEAIPLLFDIFSKNPAQIKITRPRNSKLGDYRAPFNGQPHRISVNGDLNPYAFLITFLHEYAHLHTWNQFKGKVKPHGQEWKNNFKKIMQPFFELEIFPTDINAALKSYIQNPAAASCSDLNLLKTLKLHDKNQVDVLTIEDIPQKSHFIWRDGRVFQKHDKLRKRYRCLELSTKKYYLFNPMAEVKLLDI